MIRLLHLALIRVTRRRLHRLAHIREDYDPATGELRYWVLQPGGGLGWRPRRAVDLDHAMRLRAPVVRALAELARRERELTKGDR